MKALGLLLLLSSAPAFAADRSYVVTDFDRVRVEGPFEVHVTTHATPAARVVGTATDWLDIRVEGGTLVVRASGDGWAERPRAGGQGAPLIYLRTATLRAATAIAGAKLEVTGPVRAERVDLAISGNGSIAVGALDAGQLNATLVGAGTVTLGGRAAHARLMTNGAGSIEASALQVDNLVLRLDGTGTARASARYFADVVTTGLGTVTVYGKAKCKVRAAAGGPIDCGVAPPVK